MASRNVAQLAITYRAALERVRTASAAALIARWDAMGSWSNVEAAAFLADAMPIVMAARQQSAALTGAYMAATTGTAPAVSPANVALLVRNGADIADTYAAPIVDARALYAKRKAAEKALDDVIGQIVEDALSSGRRRLAGAVDFDISRAASIAAQDGLTQASIDTYRTVTRPGACPLCVAASDNVYKTSQLQPLHTNCHCIVVPGSKIPKQLGRGLQTSRDYDPETDQAGRRVVVDFNDELGPVLDYDDQAAIVARRKAAKRNPGSARTASGIPDPRSQADRIAGKQRQIAAQRAYIDAGHDTEHNRRLLEQFSADLADLTAA